MHLRVGREQFFKRLSETSIDFPIFIKSGEIKWLINEEAVHEQRVLADALRDSAMTHPDGRCGEKQRHFEQVEREPQAVEWHFSLACRSGFRISNDNLADPAGESGDFGAAVHSQALRYCSDGLPSRAANFRTALAGSFAGIAEPEPGDFCAQGV